MMEVLPPLVDRVLHQDVVFVKFLLCLVPVVDFGLDFLIDVGLIGPLEQFKLFLPESDIVISHYYFAFEVFLVFFALGVYFKPGFLKLDDLPVQLHDDFAYDGAHVLVFLGVDVFFGLLLGFSWNIDGTSNIGRHAHK